MTTKCQEKPWFYRGNSCPRRTALVVWFRQSWVSLVTALAFPNSPSGCDFPHGDHSGITVTKQLFVPCYEALLRPRSQTDNGGGSTQAPLALAARQALGLPGFHIRKQQVPEGAEASQGHPDRKCGLEVDPRTVTELWAKVLSCVEGSASALWGVGSNFQKLLCRQVRECGAGAALAAPRPRPCT